MIFWKLYYSIKETKRGKITYGNPKTSGWRIWNIDDGGKVTIIHAGHSELYYHGSSSVASINILRNRNCMMYENEYAVEKSAHFLRGNEAAEWYNKNCLTEEERGAGLKYELESYDEDLDGDGAGDNSLYNYHDESDGLKSFVTEEEMPVIGVLENGSYYWLATADTSTYLFNMTPEYRRVFSSYQHDFGFGLRCLISLKSDTQLEQTPEKTEDGWNLWKIVKD